MAIGKDVAMLIKWIGGAAIIACCGSVGFRIAAEQRKEERYLAALVSALTFMIHDLQYRLTPLPELCRKVSLETEQGLKKLFYDLALELDDQISPDVNSCMNAAVSKNNKLPEMTKSCLLSLGQNLGKFDINGQISGIQTVIDNCSRSLDKLRNHKEQRLRSYQTLGICAGAAIAILFM